MANGKGYTVTDREDFEPEYHGGAYPVDIVSKYPQQLYMCFMTEPYQLFGASIDLERAKQMARNIEGIVVTLPIIYDGRG